MNDVAIKVNQQALVNNLKYSFTNRHIVLGELMQNARRAGSNHVSFEFAPETRTMQVKDRGIGIDCVQTLLTVSESGWDAEIIAKEHPFGLGFLSALFACEHITVISKGGRFFARTDDILSFKPIGIDPVTDWDGMTTVMMHGFSLDGQETASVIKHLAKGFPIPVFFNGVEMPRPHAISPVFLKTEIGDITLGDGCSYSLADMCVYLQGLPVYTSVRNGNPSVVHLDSSRFYARLPDRDKLIDEDLVKKLIYKELCRQARLKYERLKARLSDFDFAALYPELKAWRCLDLLNDVPVLPAGVLFRMADYPVREDLHNDTFIEATISPIFQEQVERKEVEIVLLDSLIYDGAERWMFAYRSNVLVYSDPLLDKDHWLHQYLWDLARETVEVEVLHEKSRAHFDGRWVSGQAIFCDGYRLIVGNRSVEIDNDSMYVENGSLFYVPAKDASGYVLKQASSYMDEYDTYMEGDYEADENDFSAFVIANTTDTPAQALKRLLPNALACPMLFGKAFAVHIGRNGEIEAVNEA